MNLNEEIGSLFHHLGDYLHDPRIAEHLHQVADLLVAADQAVAAVNPALGAVLAIPTQALHDATDPTPPPPPKPPAAAVVIPAAPAEVPAPNPDDLERDLSEYELGWKHGYAAGWEDGRAAAATAIEVRPTEQDETDTTQAPA